MKHQKIKGKWYLAGLAVCVLLFGVSLFQVISHYAGAQKAEEEFTKLAEIVEQTEDTPEEEPAGEEQEVISPLERYAELFAMNNDMAGWIRIEDTPINYPVMYTPDNPDYYLKHNFYKESSAYGVPYIAEHCDPMEPSDNVIIYGHHMNNGSMFAGLMNYEDRDFYERHKTVRFDTLTETAEYEVIAVFKTTVYDDTGFKFYLFSHAETEKEFTDYVEQCRELALYDTGVTATYGDKLLTLSTCEYSNTNGRLVVVAKEDLKIPYPKGGQAMGRTIKTRHVQKDIKVLDKTVTAAEHMKGAYIRTRDSAEQTQGREQGTPVGYAEDQVMEKGERAARGTVQQAGKQGKK